MTKLPADEKIDRIVIIARVFTAQGYDAFEALQLAILIVKDAERNPIKENHT